MFSLFPITEACSPRWTTQDASQASTWGCHVMSWRVSNGIYFCRRNILRVLYPSANTCALRYQWFSYTTVIHYIDDNVFPAGKLKNVKFKNRENLFLLLLILRQLFLSLAVESLTKQCLTTQQYGTYCVLNFCETEIFSPVQLAKH